MMNFDFLDNNENITIDKSIVPFKKENIDVSIIDRKHINDKVIARYFVVELDEKIKRILDEEKFNDFQKSVCEDVFFSLRNDLRWNLYIIFIESDVSVEDRIKNEIQRNDDYARKLFMSMGDFKEYIVPELTIETDRDIGLLESWHKKLKEGGLTGCLYSDFSNEKVDNYIQRGKEIGLPGRQSKKELVAKSNDELKVDNILDVRLDNFRDHCFGAKKTIPLSKVNLLWGANGSGKTSLCDAIASGFTGRENKSEEEGAVITIDYSNKGAKRTFNSEIDNNKKRERAATWYNSIPIGNIVPLRKDFEISNYLCSNVAAKYEDKSVLEFLKRIIYGEQFEPSEARIKRFKEEFEKRKRSIDKSAKEIELERAKIAIKEIAPIDKKAMHLSLGEIGFNSTEQLSEQEIEGLFARIINLQYTVMTIKEGKAKYGYANYYDLLKVKERNSSETKELEKKIAAQDAVEAEKKANETLLLKRKNAFEEQTKALENVSKIKSDFLKFSALFGAKSINQFVNEYEQLSGEIYSAKKCYDEFQQERGIKEVDFSKTTDLIEERQKKEKLEQELSLLDAQIKELTDNIGEIGSVVEKLVFLTKQSGTNVCSLCGHNYKTPAELLAAMENARRVESKMAKQLGQLNTEKVNIEKSISMTCKMIINAENQREKEVIIERVYSGLFGTERSQKTEKLSVTEKRSRILNKIAETGKEEKRLEAESDAHYLAKNILFEHEDVFTDEEFSNPCFSDVLEKKEKSVRDKTKELRKEMKALEEEIKKAKLEKDDSLQDKLKEKEIMAQYLLAIERAISEVADECKGALIKEDITKFIDDYNKVEKNIRKYQEYTVQKNEQETKMQRKNELEKTLDINKKEQERCKKAITIFNGLEKADKKAEEFIDRNAVHIEKTFKKIHRPKEFSRIKIDNGKISFSRNSVVESVDVQKSKVTPDQMSTGQKIALYTSILMTIFKAHCDSPNVLIFDEPVANLDDFHLLSLIDMIRDYAIDGTQIIFTTANPDVATIFRRKFSFMEREFQAFEFLRLDNGPTSITIKNYSHDSESSKDVVLQ